MDYENVVWTDSNFENAFGWMLGMLNSIPAAK